MSWLLSPAANTIDLSDLKDVNAPSPSDGDHLEWDGGTSMWINAVPPPAALVTVADESADTTSFPLFATAATGDLGTKSNAGFTFNALTADLNSTLIAGIANANLLDKSATETISGTYSFTPGPILLALGAEGAPSYSFIGDLDSGIYSPGANIVAVTVGGTEAVRWTGASPVLLRYSMETDITASTTQTQGQGQLTGSWNEVRTVVNNLDTVTMPSFTEGETCLIINTSSKRLQVFPFLGEDIGNGTNTPVTIKANSSRYWICIVTTGTSFDIATDFKMLQGLDVDGASDDDLFFLSSGIWTDTAGLLKWDGTTFTVNGELAHTGSKVGFYSTAPIVQQTGVAVTAAAVHAALVNLGLITA